MKFLNAHTIGLVKGTLLLILLTFTNHLLNAQTKSKQVGWVLFKEAKGAFSVDFPQQPESHVQESEDPKLPGKIYSLHLYSFLDSVKQINYLVRYNDMPVGMFLDDKNKIFGIMLSNLETMGKLVGTPKTIWKDGCEGKEGMVEIQNTFMRYRMYIRGNRFYLLLKQNQASADSGWNNDRFFDSFKFLPYNKPETSEFISKSGNFKINMPGKPEMIADSALKNSSTLVNSVVYYSVDRQSGTVFGVEHSGFSEYSRIKNPDSVQNEYVKAFSKQPNLPQKVEDITINSIKGKLLSLSDTTSGLFKKIFISVNGNGVDYVCALGVKEIVESPEMMTYFNSFTRTGKERSFDLKSSKAAKIISDLSSQDTVAYNKALGAFNFYPFTAEELPVIYEALEKEYINDTSNQVVPFKLFSILGEIHDHQTLNKLKTLYTRKPWPEGVKNKILNAIVSADSVQGFSTYFNMLLNQPPLYKNNWSAFNPLRDSLSFVAGNFDVFLGLLKYPECRNSVISIVNSMLLEPDTTGYAALIKKNRARLLTYFDEDYKSYKRSDKESEPEKSYVLYKYLSMTSMARFKEAANKISLIILKERSDQELVTSAVACRIMNHLPVAEQILSPCLDSLSTRYEILEAFHSSDQIASVPAKYTDQKEFARLLFYQYLTAEYDIPENIKLLGTIHASDSIYYSFEFSYIEEDKKKTYVGITGPFKKEDNKLFFDGYRSYTNFTEKWADWKKKSEEMIEGLKEEEDR